MMGGDRRGAEAGAGRKQRKRYFSGCRWGEELWLEACDRRAGQGSCRAIAGHGRAWQGLPSRAYLAGRGR